MFEDYQTLLAQARPPRWAVISACIVWGCTILVVAMAEALA